MMERRLEMVRQVANLASMEPCIPYLSAFHRLILHGKESRLLDLGELTLQLCFRLGAMELFLFLILHELLNVRFVPRRVVMILPALPFPERIERTSSSAGRCK